MQQLLKVKAAYEAIDDLVQKEIGAAVGANDLQAENAWSERKTLNDYAFFAVLFAQFERIAKQKFVQARDARRSNPDWTYRRGWDGDLWGQDRAPFPDLLAAVLDRRLPEYQRIIRYYADRNHVAHGGLNNQVASIDVLAADLQTIAGLLRS